MTSNKEDTMINLERHMRLLGHRVRDRVTGYEGVVTSVSFDLYGCIQAIVHPGLDKDRKPMDQNWFDVSRLERLTEDPVMTPPGFDWSPQQVASGGKGPADKPPTGKC